MKNLIYVRLIDENVDVWRPVVATEQVNSTFLIEPQLIPVDEVWQFQPGQIVLCEHVLLSGDWSWVARQSISG